MATKGKSSSTASSKGVAIAKRAKIDSAQKNMLIAVCLASILLGVTIVGIVYLSKKISFNAKKISENDVVIKNFKDAQNQLTNLSAAVSDLSVNERLEVVADERLNTNCDNSALKAMESEEGEGYDLDNIEVIRTCSALRAIADTLPSRMNQDAANSSINWLILNKNSSIKIQGISGSDDSGTSSSVVDATGKALNLKQLGINLSIKDRPTTINKAIMSIESSIRNFDISSVTISWGDYDRGANNNNDIDFNAVYRSYYSDKVGIQKNEKVICADDTSEKCAKAKGSGAQ